MSKYPYIPDKKMYAAVMGACSYIRETGYFNKAVSYYADKYNVNEEELAQHIRARQSAGQKGRESKTKGKKYKYFIVCEAQKCDADGEPYYFHPMILRGLSESTVTERFFEHDLFEHDRYRTIQADYGGAYAPYFYHVVIASFNTKAEAEKALPQWKEIAKKQEGTQL